MKRGSSFFLRSILILVGIAAVAVCVFPVPMFANGAIKLVPEFAYWKYPFLVGIYMAALLFLFALYHALKILGYIDQRNAFSQLSVDSLKMIKRSAIAVGVLLYPTAMPAVYLVAEIEDAPGLILVGLAFTSVPLVIAIFVAVLQKLLQEAIDIKSENDFTV